jgi:hypothetical protein
MTVRQRSIEGMYQRAMNLRDSTPPSGDYPANELREEAYTNTYLRCFADENVTKFKVATRIYRAALRRNAKESVNP